MNVAYRSDWKSGDAQVAGISRSPLIRLPMRSDFCRQSKNHELLAPSASDCAWSGWKAKDQRRRSRLEAECLAEFKPTADLSTYRRGKSVRTTRATADTDVAGTLAIAAPRALYAAAFGSKPKKNPPELLPPSAADRACGIRLKKIEDGKTDNIINRPHGSTYLEEKSVLTSGATPDQRERREQSCAENWVASEAWFQTGDKT
jgi:hypothetical protein